MNEEQKIRDILKGLQAAFEKLDISAWFQYFHKPCLIVFPNVVASEAEVEALAKTEAERLRFKGYAKTESPHAFHSLSVVQGRGFIAPAALGMVSNLVNYLCLALSIIEMCVWRPLASDMGRKNAPANKTERSYGECQVL